MKDNKELMKEKEGVQEGERDRRWRRRGMVRMKSVVEGRSRRESERMTITMMD